MFSTTPDLSALERRLRRVEGLLELIATRMEISAEDIQQAGRQQVRGEVAELAAAGKKIQAIKRLRELEDLDLATAKRIVDDL